MKKSRIGNNARWLAGIGIFAALAIVVSFATSFIKVGYLSLDAGDIVIVLASFIYGPISGILISLVSSLVSFFYSGTLFWGFLMDFVSSAVFAFVASAVYAMKKNFISAIIGIYVSVVTVTAVMMPLNILVTPLYMPVTVDFVIREIPRLLLPFNLFKALFNGGSVLLLYKPVVRAMRRAALAPMSKKPASRELLRASSDGGDGATDKNTSAVQKKGPSLTAISLTVGGVSVILAVAVLIILAVMNG